MKRLSAVAAICAVVAGCHDEPIRQARATLAHGIIATVGDHEIRAETVAAVAAARQWAPNRACDAVIDDALFAAGAREALPDEARSAEARVLSRALLHRIWREARQAPVGEQEFDYWSMRSFVEFDRPPGWRVVHAVVLAPSAAASDEVERARAHAERIRELVLPIVREAAGEEPPKRTGADIFIERPGAGEDPITTRFKAAVSNMDHGKLDTRFESLGVIGEDGRYIDYAKSPFDRLVESFARAATSLRERGDVSPIVETQFEHMGTRGFHVIALLERTAEHRLSRERRLAALLPDIHRARAHKARRELGASLQQSAGVEIARNADALLALP